MTETNTTAKQNIVDLAAQNAEKHRHLAVAAGATMAIQDCIAANVLNHALNTAAALSCAVDGFDYRRWMAEAERNAHTVAIVCARHGITPQLLDVAAIVAGDGDDFAQRDQAVENIARKVLNIETLTERKRDALDFHEVSVWGVRAALLAAYDLGAAAARARE